MNNPISSFKEAGIIMMIDYSLTLFLNLKAKTGKELLNIFQDIVIYNVYIVGRD